MALSATVLANLIKTNLLANDANGENLTKFCNAVGLGIVQSISGKAFTTSDFGTVPGFAMGTGTGITGLTSSLMQSAAIAAMSSTGVNAAKLMQSIMDATVQHLSTAAALNSVHTFVWDGTGTIDIGSIAVTIPNMASNIDAALAAEDATGYKRADLALAIATGIVSNILAAGSGTVTIVGFGTDGGPAAGSGTGTIT